MVALHSLIVALSLTAAPETVLLDFSAGWCGPCRQMEPVLQQLTSQGYPIRKIDVDRDRAAASQYQVTGLPCFVLLINGREVDRQVGAVDAAQLVAMFEKAGIGGQGSAARGRDSAVVDPFAAAASVAMNAPAAGVIPATVSPTAFLPDTNRRPAGAPAGSVQDRVMAASVRIKIQDPDGNSVGSGTIIDAREGEALVLTCGHVFRDSQGKGKITIDVFAPQPAREIPARLIKYDLKSDVGLVSFRTPVPVTVAHVASAQHQLVPGSAVINVGCSHGAEPTARDSRITALNRFMGPPNVQVAGQPVQGRSGGGLFTADGQVIGVCNAADPSANEGLYAALGSIHTALDGAGLSAIYSQPDLSSEKALAAITPPAMPNRMPDSPARSVAEVATSGGSPFTDAVPNSVRLAAASAKSEVICIIRPTDERSQSEIIVLDRATPAFLEWLATEQRTQSGRQLTSMQVASSTDAASAARFAAAPAGRTMTSPTIQPATHSSLRWLRPRTPTIAIAP